MKAATRLWTKLWTIGATGALAACGDAEHGGIVTADVDAGPDLGVEVGDDATMADAPNPDDADAAAVDADDGAAAPDAPPGDVALADETTAEPPLAVYDPSVVHEVALTLAPADWEALRNETRTLFQVLGPGCLDGPAPDGFNWYRADVVVDGRALADVGLKKKGFLGSLDPVRPALRVETDHWVADQELGGLEHLTLNNGKQDPSRLHQCLAYGVFNAAGVPAPRCSFAHVTVNGADLGLYVNVEPLKKAFVRERFGDGGGQLWEGTLSDFRPDFMLTFDPKIDSAPTDRAPLEAVTSALEAPDDALLAGLDAVLDLDAFFTFWAAEVLVAHWDGYAGNTNNFFVYQHADGRLRFIPWGVDGTFIDLTATGQGTGRPTSVLAVGALAHRLYAHPEGRARYHAALRRLLAEVWDEAALTDQIAAWDVLTRDAREAGTSAVGAADVAALKAFVQGRRQAIEAELASPPDWTEPLRAPLCMHDAGTVTGSFDTTWDTLAIDNLFTTGTGTLAVSSTDLPPLTFQEIGAKAGEDVANLPGVGQLVLAAHVVGAGFVAVFFQTRLPLAGGTVPVDHVDTAAYVYYLEGNNPAQLVGLLADGDLVFDAADARPGGDIRASFRLTLYML